MQYANIGSGKKSLQIADRWRSGRFLT